MTQRVTRAETGEIRDALDQMLTRWLRASGFLAVPVPNALASDETDSWLVAWLERIRPDAIVLSGGNDIGEAVERDMTERQLLTWAAAGSVPVLGICRGLQMMAVWGGGELTRAPGHVAVRHTLRPAGAVDWLPREVNSFHEWGLAGCPQGFEVTATVEDGGIEAIRHAELPWEGWMWHPERERPFAAEDRSRAEALLGR